MQNEVMMIIIIKKYTHADDIKGRIEYSTAEMAKASYKHSVCLFVSVIQKVEIWVADKGDLDFSGG